MFMRLTVLLGLLFSFGLKAQTVQWARSGTSPGYEYGNGIITDDSGNVYVTGQIEYTTNFDSVSLSSNGSHDIFFGKYDTHGNIRWLHSAGGIRGDVGWGVGLDASYNSYYTGEFELSAIFYNGDSIVSSGSNDIFLVKYDYNGNLLWEKGFGNDANDKGKAIAVMPNGDCYLTGYFGSGVNFGGTTLTSSGDNDIFIVKTDAGGNVRWAKRAGGAERDRGHGVAYDRFGNVYVTGIFTHAANFSGTTITNTGKGGAFLAKYDTSGNFKWVRPAGGCCDTTQANSLTIDADGNVYVAGFFEGTTSYGPNNLSSSGSTDITLAKFDSSGNVLWLKQAGGPYEDEANSIKIDTATQRLYVTGQLDDHGYFDTQYVGAAGNRDVFVACYDLNGQSLWAKAYGGVLRDIGQAITLDAGHNIYVTGTFNDTAVFGSYTLSGFPLADFFVSKFSSAPAAQPTVQAQNLSADSVNCSDLALTFVPGNGTGRLVIARAAVPVNTAPVDGITYNADAVYGNGSSLGNGNYVVYAGNGTSVTVTGLPPGSTCYFSVFEYNDAGGSINYLTGGPATGNHTAGNFEISAASNSSSVCEGDSLTFIASGASSYSWSPATGLSALTGAQVRAAPSTSRTYTVTGVNNIGCEAQAFIAVSVHPNPVVTYNTFDSVCVNGSPVMLSGGLPVGGNYSGSGVSNGQFDPAWTGPGSFTVNYEYTDANGCSNSAHSSVVVHPSPAVQLGNDTILCAGNALVLDAGTGFASYSWSTGAASQAISIDSTGTGFGTITCRVVVTDTNGCFAVDSARVTFDACLSVESLPYASNLFSFYPNPFRSTITLEYIGKFSFEIYDETGQLLERNEVVSGSCRVGENLSPGIYWLLIENREGRKGFKVVKFN
jgi:hypothetical protein